jgi:hypothetical protein
MLMLLLPSFPIMLLEQRLVVDFELLQAVMLLVVLRQLVLMVVVGIWFLLLSRDRGGGGCQGGELRFGYQWGNQQVKN